MGDLVEEAAWGGRVLGRPVDLLSGPVSMSVALSPGTAGLGRSSMHLASRLHTFSFLLIEERLLHGVLLVSAE